MILAVDVDYKGTSAQVGGVVFSDWKDPLPSEVLVTQVENVEEYVPGSFYKRELPCILSLLSEHRLKPDCIVIDGFVFLDGDTKPGLGKHLYDALEEDVAVVGVAKSSYDNISKKFAVYRGESRNPLYVTSAGMELSQAKTLIKQMHGEYRIPYLLKKVDQICRGKG